MRAVAQRLVGAAQMWLPPQGVLRNAGWLLLGEVVNRASRFSLSLLVARHFGPEGFGYWSFVLSLATLLAILAEFGFPVVVTRNVAREPDRTGEFLAIATAPKLVLGAGAYLLTILLAWLVGPGGPTLHLALALGAFAVLDTFAQLLFAIFRAHERMLPEAVGKAVQGLTMLVVGATILFLADTIALVAVGPLVGVGFGLLVGAVFYARLGQPFRWRIESSSVRAMIQAALPIVVSSAAFLIYLRIDTVLLTWLRDERETGLYNAAVAYVFPFSFLPILFVNAIYPRMSRAGSGGDLATLYRQSSVFLAGCGALLVLGGAATANLVYLRVYGPAFRDSVGSLYLLLPAAALYFLSHFNYFILYASDREGIVMRLTLIGAGINVGLNLLLIPMFGAQGAALATLATECVVLGTLLAINREKLIRPRTRARPRSLP